VSPGGPGARAPIQRALRSPAEVRASPGASDEFAKAMRESFAAKRPSEAELEPTRSRPGRDSAGLEAMRAELEPRKLDERHASDEAKREATLAELEPAV
jgi:hypothetical protein